MAHYQYDPVVEYFIYKFKNDCNRQICKQDHQALIYNLYCQESEFFPIIERNILTFVNFIANKELYTLNDRIEFMCKDEDGRDAAVIVDIETISKNDILIVTDRPIGFDYQFMYKLINHPTGQLVTTNYPNLFRVEFYIDLLRLYIHSLVFTETHHLLKQQEINPNGLFLDSNQEMKPEFGELCTKVEKFIYFDLMTHKVDQFFEGWNPLAIPRVHTEWIELLKFPYPPKIYH